MHAHVHDVYTRIIYMHTYRWRRTDESGTEEGRMVEVKLSPEPKEVVKVTSSGYYLLQQVCGARGPELP